MPKINSAIIGNVRCTLIKLIVIGGRGELKLKKSEKEIVDASVKTTSLGKATRKRKFNFQSSLIHY